MRSNDFTKQLAACTTMPTPSQPWTIRDQVAHLAFFDEKGALAARDPDSFLAGLDSDFAGGMDGIVAQHHAIGRGMTPVEVLDWWRAARRAFAEALRSVERAGSSFHWRREEEPTPQMARALLEHETISGAEVHRLLAVAAGNSEATPLAEHQATNWH